MKIIPEAKSIKLTGGVCDAKNIAWSFAEGTDERVVAAAERIAKSSDGVKAFVSHGSEKSEGYTLTIGENEIEIKGESAAGAFYGIMTLKMLLKSSDGKIECAVIADRPDMEYRGFYQDTTRGRIPTLETLKKLADDMADYKMNSLQLYVEHSFDFKEYAHCKEELGYLTADEIKELDKYCSDRFIELIPSLSTFGHLYHLLQSDEYKHLCELNDYKPSRHYWPERMHHHTINPLLDESFSLITSLIDQHMAAFTSDKFNICCDETFDLGNDVNKDKDKGELYIGFVKKLINYLEAKGKTVIMWGDIVLQHPDRLPELSDKVIFGNWDYDKEPSEEKIAALADRVQYVCPGTSSWLGFSERIDIEEGNILTLTKYGAKYGAKGILNTNWGDLGNPATIEMAMYGLILGAAAGWNTATEATAEFRSAVGKLYYGNSTAVELLAEMSEVASQSNWLNYNYDEWKYADESEEAFKNAQAKCEILLEKLENSDLSADVKKEFLAAAKGYSLLIKWNAYRLGYSVPSKVDFNDWMEDFKELWYKASKESELKENIKVYTAIENNKEFF